MFEEYIRHNLFIKGLDKFEDDDPHLAPLKDIKFVHPMDWWKGMDWKKPGIYILTGGRQIGKTTSTKLLIKHVIKNELFDPQRIFYLPCDQIDDHHHLSRTIRLFIEELGGQSGGRFLLVIDEVTFVKEWDRAIKALADEGTLHNGFCILTGSDTIILKDAANRFPGRRGDADVVDIHLYPLNFYEYLQLTSPALIDKPEEKIETLFDSFEKYLRCGGYLKAINELHMKGEIGKATYLTFEQWIRGDFDKRNKNIATLIAILDAIFRSSGTQVTFSSLANKMGMVSKETFIDYLSLLERMDVIFILQAFDQNTRRGFPKKARKIHFCDPFIMDTIEKWLVSERVLTPTNTQPLKAESITASNFHRIAPTYYVKADGEIDVVVVKNKIFTPIEVKWTNQLRQSDLKQLKKYRNSIILTKGRDEGMIEGVKAIPLPLFLARYV